MKNYKLYIFDADETLRRCTVMGQPCPNRPGEWELIPGVKERLAQIDWSTTSLGVASNQAGIALGYTSEVDVYAMLGEMVAQATGYWPPVNSIRICPHAPTAGCDCRKPGPAMLQRLMEFWRTSPAETLFVGDQESDRVAARRAICDFMLASEFFGNPMATAETGERISFPDGQMAWKSKWLSPSGERRP